MFPDHVGSHKALAVGPIFWGMIQSEPELKAIGIAGLQFLQVLSQDDILFCLVGKKQKALGWIFRDFEDGPDQL